MIQETYCSFEQAKALKELGFPQDGHEDYYLDGFTFVKCATCKTYAKITLSLVQKWLREEKGLFIEITTDVRNVGFSYYILEKDTEPNMHGEYGWDSPLRGSGMSEMFASTIYEQALSAGIDRCIELLKETKE